MTIKSKLIFILTFFLLIIITPNLKVQGKEVNINHLNSDITILKDGSLKIDETLTMNFNGKFNGAFRDISDLDTSGLSDLKIYLLEDGSLKEFTKVSDASNGDSFKYTLEKDKDMNKIKLYIPSKNQERVFKLSYILNGVITKFNDGSLLNFNIWSKNFKTPLEYVSGNIYFSNYNKNNVKILNEDSNINYDLKDNYIFYDFINKDKDNPNISIILRLPNGTVESSPKSINSTLDDYFKAQNDLKNKNIQEANKRKEIFKIISIIILVIGTILFFIYLFIYLKFKKSYNKEDVKAEDLSSISPAMANYILYKHLDEKAFSGELMNLYKNGYVDINFKENYITFPIKILDSLRDSEKYFLIWLKNMATKKSVLTLKTLKNKGKKGDLNEGFEEWKIVVKNDLLKENYLSNSHRKLASRLIILGILSILFGGFCITGSSSLISIHLIIIGFIEVYLGISLKTLDTPKAKLQRQNITRMIKYWYKPSNKENFFKKYPIEIYLPYFISFNLSEFNSSIPEFLDLNISEFTSLNSIIFFSSISSADMSDYSSNNINSTNGSSGGYYGGGCSGGGAGGF